jgi:hypothetical protein
MVNVLCINEHNYFWALVTRGGMLNLVSSPPLAGQDGNLSDQSSMATAC